MKAHCWIVILGGTLFVPFRFRRAVNAVTARRKLGLSSADQLFPAD